MPDTGMYLLIVEDEIFLREAFRLMLEDSGYHVLEAGTGADALAIAEQYPPDLVLLDLGLPDCHGLDIARKLKTTPRTAHTIIVALTGRVGSAEKRASLEAGCTAHFAKPVSPKELLRRLPDLLQTGRAARPPAL
jgi:CheY-like chemotaxis protein